HPNKEGHGVIYELLSEAMEANAPAAAEPVTYTPPTDSADESVPTGNADITVIGAVGALALAAAVVSSKKRK
ncbi:MAG: hypothetical protein ACI4K7_03725, partial [Oscillospiraceae bacterium]